MADDTTPTSTITDTPQPEQAPPNKPPTTRELAARVDEITTRVSSIADSTAAIPELVKAFQYLVTRMDDIQKAPPANNAPASPNTGERVIEPAPEGPRLSDDDLHYIAAQLGNGDLERLAMLARGAKEADRLKSLGIIPGAHLIPTSNVRATRRGKDGKMGPGKLVHGEPVLREDLDPAELEDMLARKVRPGHGALPVALLVEPGTAEAARALSGE
jgi:hypothetical protein